MYTEHKNTHMHTQALNYTNRMTFEIAFIFKGNLTLIQAFLNGEPRNL